MPYAILITISCSDLINSCVIGWLVYKILNKNNIQHAEAFPYMASAPEADIEMIDTFNENVEMKAF